MQMPLHVHNRVDVQLATALRVEVICPVIQHSAMLVMSLKFSPFIPTAIANGILSGTSTSAEYDLEADVHVYTTTCFCSIARRTKFCSYSS